MQVYIPSRGRSELVWTKTVRELSPVLTKPGQLIVMVRPDEFEEYITARPDHMEYVSVYHSEHENMAETRLNCGLSAERAGESKFVMVDDDVGFLVRKSSSAWPLRGAALEDLQTMLDMVEDQLDYHAHVGVSTREGNNRAGVGHWLNLVQRNTRTNRFLAYRTREFLSVKHDRVQVMEDFDVNLQLLRAGHSNVNLCYWAQGQSQTQAPGGCSAYRTHEVHEESARRLAELHAPYVRLRQKKNKTDADGFGTRTEVTIQWKRAYDEGIS